MIPWPVRTTDCGLSKALSVIVTLPVLVPACVGVKVTLTVQLAPTASEFPQVFVWAKSPLAPMLVMSRVAVPGLVTVTACDALVV